MFGLTHWIIVLLIALVVFGPEKLPELARTLGKVLAEFRRASTDFRRVVEDELYDIERQTRERERQAALATSAAHAVPETVVPEMLPQPPGAVPTDPPVTFPAAALSSESGPETPSGVIAAPESAHAAAMPAAPPNAEGHADRS